MRRFFTATVAAVSMIVLHAGSLPAEVSIQAGGTSLYVHASTSGQIWAPIRQGIAPRFLLDPMGDARGDVFGDWGINPVTGAPEVVWARNAGGQYDVVFSWWDGQDWQGPVPVSSSPANDQRPLLYHDAHGSRYVVWTAWRPEGSEALISGSRAGAPDFDGPFALQTEDAEGLLPSGWVTDRSLLTVHEERTATERRLQVLEFPLLEPCFRNPFENPFGVGSVNLGGTNSSPMAVGLGWKLGRPLQRPPADDPDADVPSDPRVHLEDGILWVDWIQDEGRMGYAVYDGSDFGDPVLIGLRGPADVEKTRKQIRLDVLKSRNR